MPGATITSYRSIIINEVAWSGTAASANDEWIELYNPSNVAINITGWVLKSASTAPSALNITLSGSISSGGYFLLERGNNFVVSDVTADQVYPGASLNILSDDGERLILCGGTSTDALCGGTTFIDTANSEGSSSSTNPWPKGGLSPNYGSMERVGTSAEKDNTWATNIGTPKNGLNANNGSIYGTPKKVNSRGTNPTPVPPLPTSAFVPLVGRVIINEFLPRPGFDWNQDGKVDVFDEFIEIKNIGTASVSIGGWRLDDEADQGSNPFTLPAVTLKPGERTVFYGSQTNILLSDGGDTVRLINPSGKVYDAYTYAIAKVEDQSVCRLPDGITAHGTKIASPRPTSPTRAKAASPSMPDRKVSNPPSANCPTPSPLIFSSPNAAAMARKSGIHIIGINLAGTKGKPSQTTRASGNRLFSKIQTLKVSKTFRVCINMNRNSMESFFSFLEKRVDNSSSLLCVGLDPHIPDLKEPTAASALDFCLTLVKQTAPYAAAFKPNAAFFEIFGAEGWVALKQVIEAIHEESIRLGSMIPVILDAKRGDIASTAEAYARSAFENLGAHCITLNPYLGKDSIDPFIQNPEKGVFLLCKTSNAGSGDLQDLSVLTIGHAPCLYNSCCQTGSGMEYEK